MNHHREGEPPNPRRSHDPTATQPGDETIDFRPELHATLADHLKAVDEDGFPLRDDLIGRTLGQYRLGRVIGRGSMARVHHAEHLGLGRSCAIKIMNPGLIAHQPQIVERFWAEARAAAHLVHPHVVTIHNLGFDRGYHFIEMELVPGGHSLKEVLLREGPLQPLRATTLVHQVTLALGAAHRAGIIHRDVKPANVLLSVEGLAKLADFGLVQRSTDRDLGTARVAGTPSFMAPELFEGTEADPRSDLYAIGVMYFYLLTGRLPYVADRIDALIELHRAAPIPDLRAHLAEAPDPIVATITRLLAKDPSGRPESTEELADSLRATIGQLRDTDDLVAEALAGLDVQLHRGECESYRVVVPLPSQRLHEVFLESVRGRQGERLLTVFSVCAPASGHHFEFALRLNAELTYGSLSIRNVEGQPMFVMSRTFDRQHVGAADIRAAVQEIARQGDRVEERLTQADHY
jgi:serine/threonine-protein kinase